jgi:hypothetical protein
VFKNREKIIERVANMPEGENSSSNHYWCVTCKMLFTMEKPVCPYMTKVCINTPIPVEMMGPESTISLEKFGLFYPKIPQKVVAYHADGDPHDIAEKWVSVYINFLKEWKFQFQHEPLQTIKSFIVSVSGCETGQRVQSDKITFVLTDIGKVWNKQALYDILTPALELLKKELSIEQSLALDDIDIVGEEAAGKYYCAMCRKFFEFSTQRNSITCPLMAQKCMATPTDIEKIKYQLDDLIYVYQHTPDIYRNFVEVLETKSEGKEYLKGLLTDEWLFDVDNDSLESISNLLGIR